MAFFAARPTTPRCNEKPHCGQTTDRFLEDCSPGPQFTLLLFKVINNLVFEQ